MPTPTGLAKKGDVLASPAGRRWRVIERLGNDEIYAVRVVPIDGQPLPLDSRSRGYMIVTELPYWLRQGWKFIR